MASTKFLFLLYFFGLYSSELATGEGFLLLKLIQKMDKFNLEKLYKEYLDMVVLDEEQMHPIQKIETKRAFYGGCGMMFRLMVENIPKIQEKMPPTSFDEVQKQISDFFENSIKEQERRCTYCGSNEPCEGTYPEDCFFEEQILK